MTIKRTYYRGILSCQFSTRNRSKLGPLNHQSEIVLEPRFRLLDAQEISESEMPEISDFNNDAHIFQKSNSDVEIYSSLYPSGIKRTFESVLLILDKKNGEDLNSNPIETYLNNTGNEKPFQQNFHALKNNDNHGKITGLAFFTVSEKLDAAGNVLIPEIKVNIPSSAGNLFLINKKIVEVGNFTTDLSRRKGCASILNPFRSNGLLPSIFGGSSSSGRSGCMSMLKLFGLLGFLLGLFSMLMNTCNKNKAQVLPTPIHDTIFQEVIKTVTDTLTITKSDTVSFVDSTIKTTYEMVSLPNVQFYTNSRVLLPGSANDLQKLAEYLLKNDNLNATIYGHTDNVGKPDENLKLSQERAESVKQFLTSLGVLPERLKAIGMGDKKPKADNSKEEGRMLNRRVEVKLMEQEKVETKRTQLEEN